MKDSTFPRPAPIIALVGVSISGIPGPPLGPSPLITITLPYKGKKIVHYLYFSHKITDWI